MVFLVLHPIAVLTTKPIVVLVLIILHVRSEVTPVGPVVSTVRSVVSCWLAAAPSLGSL